MKKKILTAALMTTLVATLSVGATLAYLSATTSEVKNTFVAGQIGDLTLGESTDDYEDENGNHCYVVVPGQKITKDPVVTFTYADDNNKDTKKDTPRESSPNINITNEIPSNEPTLEMPEEEPVEEPTEEAPTEGEASYLPSPDELGISLVDND